MAHSRFKISVSRQGQHSFELATAKGEVILASGPYTSREGLESGLASVRANAPIEQRYQRDSQDTQHCFSLQAANGEVIGRSELYSSQVVMERAIESLKSTAATAPIEIEDAPRRVQVARAHAIRARRSARCDV